jgi:hypothetical protein
MRKICRRRRNLLRAEQFSGCFLVRLPETIKCCTITRDQTEFRGLQSETPPP